MRLVPNGKNKKFDCHVADMGPAEIDARYIKERMDGLRTGSLAHLMSAQV